MSEKLNHDGYIVIDAVADPPLHEQPIPSEQSADKLFDPWAPPLPGSPNEWLPGMPMIRPANVIRGHIGNILLNHATNQSAVAIEEGKSKLVSPLIRTIRAKLIAKYADRQLRRSKGGYW